MLVIRHACPQTNTVQKKKKNIDIYIYKLRNEKQQYYKTEALYFSYEMHVGVEK